MQGKYENIKDDYFVANNSYESTLFVNQYIDENWTFDGNHFKKSTEDRSSTDVKIPLAIFSIREFLTYVDELTRLRDYLIQRKPNQNHMIA